MPRRSRSIDSWRAWLVHHSDAEQKTLDVTARCASQVITSAYLLQALPASLTCIAAACFIFFLLQQQANLHHRGSACEGCGQACGREEDAPGTQGVGYQVRSSEWGSSLSGCATVVLSGVR